MIYCISDIHGAYEPFMRLMNAIKFDKNKDTLYALGDYIDFSEGGVNTIKYLMELENTGRCIPLIGNHELMFLSCIEHNKDKKPMTEDEAWENNNYVWLTKNSGLVTWNHFCEETDSWQDKIYSWMKRLRYRINVTSGGKHFVLCHAYPMPSVPSADPNFEAWRYSAVWKRDTVYTKVHNLVNDDDIVIHGHTIEAFEKDGHWSILKEPQGYNIDCGAKTFVSFKGDGTPKHPEARLAALRLDDMAEFYVGKDAPPEK